jgi:hypothetical protein
MRGRRPEVNAGLRRGGISPLTEGVGGRYFADECEALSIPGRTSDLSGVAPYALDPVNAERLWEASLRMLGQARS